MTLRLHARTLSRQMQIDLSNYDRNSNRGNSSLSESNRCVCVCADNSQEGKLPIGVLIFI